MIALYFILTIVTSLMTSSYGQLSCASGWELNGGKCYLINPGFNSGSTFGGWNQCNSYCQKSYLDASMLCIQDGNQNNWLTSKYGAIFWVGYTDMPPYGGGKGSKNYGWVTGCSSTYTNWYSGSSEPNNAGDYEDCTMIWTAGDDYGTSERIAQWNDADCANNDYQCGCQYTLSPTAKSPSLVPTSKSTITPTALSVMPVMPSTVTSTVPTTIPTIIDTGTSLPESRTITCAESYEGGFVSLTCSNGLISAIDFASYGTPSGKCGAYTASSWCHASSSYTKVYNTCIHLASCSIEANNNVFGDPCDGTTKRLYIQVTCANTPGPTYGPTLAPSTIPTAITTTTTIPTASTTTAPTIHIAIANTNLESRSNTQLDLIVGLSFIVFMLFIFVAIGMYYFVKILSALESRLHQVQHSYHQAAVLNNEDHLSLLGHKDQSSVQNTCIAEEQVTYNDIELTDSKIQAYNVES